MNKNAEKYAKYALEVAKTESGNASIHAHATALLRLFFILVSEECGVEVGIFDSEMLSVDSSYNTVSSLGAAILVYDTLIVKATGPAEVALLCSYVTVLPNISAA